MGVEGRQWENRQLNACLMAEQLRGGPPVPDHTLGSAKTAELEIGTGVVITGLASAKELNGQVGEIVSYDASTTHYSVITGSNSEKGFNIKRANLICCSEQLEEQDIEYNHRRNAAMLVRRIRLGPG